jgi:CTD small phosphatase-like protein 2
LNYLDPKRSIIHHRLYRDSCVIVDGIYIKDLRIILNWDVKDIVIIDNAAYSFGYQLDNGIPIISWHDDKYDKELYNLMDYMKLLAGKVDIREQNRKVFKLYTFFEDY